ncbi:MAG: hypothetical protein PVJ39_06090 [Gammaproteobacteria bacterium]|jgi:hypothetical protein
MGTKTHKFTFDFSSLLVFTISAGIGLYIVYELIAAYVKLFH